MKYNILDKEETDTDIIVSISPDEAEYAKLKDKVTLEYKQKATITGFRKGKAPIQMVLDKYEKDIFLDSYEVNMRKALEFLEENGITSKFLPDLLEYKEDKIKLRFYKDIEVILPESCIKIDRELNKSAIEKIEALTFKLTDDDVVKLIDNILSQITYRVSELLIDRYTEEEFSESTQKIEKLGLVLADYISSIGLTEEQYKANIRKKVVRDIIFSFFIKEYNKKKNLTINDNIYSEFKKHNSIKVPIKELKDNVNVNYYLEMYLTLSDIINK